MSVFLAERYSLFKEYVPGEQPSDRKYVKLNTNESPYPPTPLLKERLTAQSLDELCLYPDPQSKKLKSAIAKAFGVGINNVFVSNGSDETLYLAFLGLCPYGVAFPEISYGFYPVYADFCGLDALKIPLRDDFSIDEKQYMNIGRTVVIANPNAPTGIFLENDRIEAIAASNPGNIVLIDEAYIDFAGETAIPLTKKYTNLLVVRTFSKAYALAGARLGYAIGSEEVIADLEKLKYSINPYNINRLTQEAGIAAVEDRKYHDECCAKIIKERERSSERLRSMGFTVIDSKANFIFVKHKDHDAQRLYLLLREKGVLVRYFSDEKIRDYLRITIGTPEQMDILAEKLETIMAEEERP